MDKAECAPAADNTQGSLSLSSTEDTTSIAPSETGIKPSGSRKRKEKKWKLKKTLTPVQVNRLMLSEGFTIQDFEEVKEKKRSPDEPKSQDMAAFWMFWRLYPKKDIVGAALRQWKKMQPDSETVEKIVRDVQKRTKSFEWTKDNGKWIPYAHSYLANQRWLDQGVDQSLIQGRTVL